MAQVWTRRTRDSFRDGSTWRRSRARLSELRDQLRSHDDRLAHSGADSIMVAAAVQHSSLQLGDNESITKWEQLKGKKLDQPLRFGQPTRRPLGVKDSASIRRKTLSSTGRHAAEPPASVVSRIPRCDFVFAAI